MDFVILVIMLMVWGFMSFSESSIRASVERELKQSEEQAPKRIEAQNAFIEKYTNEKLEYDLYNSDEGRAEIAQIEKELRNNFPELNKLHDFPNTVRMVLLARRGLVPNEFKHTRLGGGYGRFMRYYNDVLMAHGVPGLYIYGQDNLCYFNTNKPLKAVKDTVDEDFDEYKLISWPEYVDRVDCSRQYIFW